MKVNDIMTKDVIKVDVNTSLEEVSKIMKEHNIGSLPVADGQKIVGIITDRDIVVRGMANSNSASLTVRDIMSTNPVTCSSDKDVLDAARIMSERQIRRLVVLDNNDLVGMVSLGDLAVENVPKDEVGEALKEISIPCCPN